MMSHQEAYKKLLSRVKQAHLRHNLLILLVAFLQSLFYATLAAGILTCALSFTPWAEWRGATCIAFLALVLPGTLILFMSRRRPIEYTALLADDHLFLKEKITSALELGKTEVADHREQEWCHALLTDALNSAYRIDLKKAFPLISPPEAKWLWAPAFLLLLTLYVLPQWDLLTGYGSAEATAMEAKKIEKDMAQIMQRQLVFERKALEEKNQVAAELSKEIKKLADELKKDALSKRDALAQISSLENKWKERKELLESGIPKLGEGSSSQTLTREAQELEKALKEGNMAKAEQAMQSLQKKLKTDDLDESEREKLAEDLKKLSKMLGSDFPMSAALNNAAKFLEAGELADSLGALEMGEMDLKNLQELMQQMKLLAEAQDDLEESKCKLLGICSTCKSGNCSGNGQCASPFAGMGGWSESDSRNQGGGMKGAGIGQGGKAPFEETDTEFETAKLPGSMNEGPIQGIFEMKGPANRGDSQLELDSIGISSAQQTEAALTQERIPASMRNQVRAYFNSLESSSPNTESRGE